MTGFDYVALIVLGLSVLASVIRGAVREIMALVSWIGSTLIALHFAPAVSAWLPAAISGPTLRLAAAFVAVLLVCLLLFSFVSLAAAKLVMKSGMTATDRTLGALFGLLRGVAILVVLVLIAGLTPLPREPAWRNALFSPPLEALALVARNYLPQRVAEHIHFDRAADA
jgi:membrane protein required for colicin V production